jgi:hypothetical protein
MQLRVRGSAQFFTSAAPERKPPLRALVRLHLSWLLDPSRLLQQEEVAQEFNMCLHNEMPVPPDLPLHPNQEHLLLSREFFRLQKRDLSPTTVPSILHLRGPLDRSTLQRTLDDIVSCHAALRTSIVSSGILEEDQRAFELNRFAQSGVFRPRMYRQVVIDRCSISLGMEDLTGQSGLEQEAALLRCITREASKGFDYKEPPLLRATLLQTAPEEHLLILIIDHLVSDAWSMRIFRRQFVELYHQHVKGQIAPNVAEGSFADYIVELEERISAGALQASMNYWKAQWSEFGAARIGFEDLAFSVPDAKNPQPMFCKESLAFDADFTREIKLAARQNRVTLYVLFLAAYAVLLSRYTKKDRIALWGHFANRANSKLQNAMGWFANTHLLGIDLQDRPTWKDLLQRVMRVVLSATEHQELPVSLVWRDLGAYPRDPDARLLMDLSVTETIQQSSEPGSLLIEPAPHLAPSFGRPFALGLNIRTGPEQMEASVHYSADRFPAEAIRRLLVDFREVVGELAASHR